MAKKFSPDWWAELRPEQAGKETEKMLESVFKERNHFVDFAWHRLPDAKAARGALAAQPADYIVASIGDAYFVEVKALKHEYRLPKDRVSQLPTLMKFDHAGMQGLILVHHYTLNVWRWVWAYDLEFGVPSWDLRGRPTYSTVEEALISAGVIQ